MNLRYYKDADTDRPHMHRHQVNEFEVEEVLRQPDEDRLGSEGSRIAIGRTSAGRHLRVVYVPEPEASGVFVITAYELRGKPLAAFRRRLRRRNQP